MGPEAARAQQPQRRGGRKAQRRREGIQRARRQALRLRRPTAAPLGPLLCVSALRVLGASAAVLAVALAAAVPMFRKLNLPASAGR